MPTVQKYYPSLNNLITLDDIPDSVDFLKSALTSLFSKIHYKDFQSSVSSDGSTAFYSLRIVAKDRIDCDLFFGLKFILNRDVDNLGISSFPVTLQYNWPIIAYLKAFDLQSFTFTPREFYEMGLIVFNISEEQVLAHAINTLVTPLNSFGDPIHQFVDEVNSKLAADLTAPIPYPTSDNKLRELSISLTDQLGDLGSIAVFLSYIVDHSDVQATKDKVKTFFEAFVPHDIEEYLLKIIKPEARVTLELSASIEFPRNILRPWLTTSTPDPLPESKVYFDFAKAILYADTKTGIGYQLELAGTLHPQYGEIGKTGLLIEIESLKLDLSKNTNIPEAEADGRPDDFTGVYARAISVTLPARWFHESTTPGTASTSLRLAAYDLLIGTGGVSGTFMLETVPSIITGGTTYYFDHEFDLHYPVVISKKNVTTDVIENVTAVSLPDLKLKLFPSTVVIPPSYTFIFPITLTEKPAFGGQERTFENIKEYQAYLSSLPTDNPTDSIPTLWKKLGGENGFSIGFNKFDITFKQDVVVESNILGRVKIPKLKDTLGNDAEIIFDGHLEQDGDFNLTASEPEGIKCNLFNVLDITFQTVEIGKENDVFYIGADTKISFPEGSFIASVFDDQEIDLPALRFYANGHFEITGGTTFIPTNITIGIGPIAMNITGIHLGNIQRDFNGRMRTYNYIGFDGAMSVDPIGLDIRGSGVKYYYTVDCDEDPLNVPDSYLFISTLEVDLIIPGTAKPEEAVAIIKGSITIPEPGVSTEYKGKVSLQLPKAKIYGEARFRLDPNDPSFLVEAEVQPPAPIPLGPIAINSFRGLLGLRYVAEKRAIGMTDENSWYDYYMAPEKGIHTEKFSGPELTKEYDNPFSVGVGATFSSMEGGGRIASLRAMVLLSVPSLFAIDAGLTLLSERLGLAEDDSTNPPFYAFVIIADDTLEFGATAKFSLNKSKGYFLSIDAYIAAGFFFKNQKPWYVNFGTPTKPVTAKLFKEVLNVNSQAYLMISSAGIAAGATATFKFNLIIAKFTASVEVGGFISFERAQIGGYAILKGEIRIKFGPFKLNIYISVHLTVEMPKPFLIYAKFTIRVCARIGFFKVCVPAKFTLKWNKNNQLPIAPIAPLTYLPTPPGEKDYPKLAQTKNFVKGVNMLTYEEFELRFFGVNTGIPDANSIDAILPLDTYIDIKVEKGLNPMPLNAYKIGGHTGGAINHIDLIPPKKVIKNKTIRQFKHKYSIESLEIFAWKEPLDSTPGAWVEYHPFRAILPHVPNPAIDNLKIGFWQRNGKQYDTLRILATNPFSFLDGAEPGWFVPEQYGITPSELFCTSTREEWHCANVLDQALNTVFTTGLLYDPAFSFNIDGALFVLGGLNFTDTDIPELDNVSNLTVLDIDNPHNFAQSLVFRNSENLIITLPEPSVRVKLKITTTSQGVTINYFRAGINDGTVLPTFELIESVHKTAAELTTEIEFDNETNFDPTRIVCKIEVLPDFPGVDEIQLIQAQIEEMLVGWEESEDGTGGSFLAGAELDLFNQLSAQLNHLKLIGCTSVQGTGSSEPCEKDELLCGLLQRLKEMYQHCFLSLTVENINNYFQELSCFEEFMALIKSFNSVHPSYSLISHMASLFEGYSSHLSQLEFWSMDGHHNPNDHEVLQYYNAFLSMAVGMMDVIEEMGHCDCGPCEKDELLCGLYTSLLGMYNDCFVERDLNNISEYCTESECFKAFINLVDVFDKDHPDYLLISEHIRSQYATFHSQLNTLVSWCMGTGNPGLSEKLAYYNSFRENTMNLIVIIRDMGNCTCGEPAPCQKDPVLCNFYNELNSLYADCFIERNLNNISEYCTESECFRNFVNLVAQFDKDHPGYLLINEHIHSQYDTYNSQFNMLSLWCLGIENASPSEKLAYYNSFRENTMSLITIVGEMGNCNCGEHGPCQKDPILCNLYNQLNRLYADCFKALTVNTIYEYCEEMACFREFEAIIKVFDAEHGVYNLIHEHIPTQYDLMDHQINALNSYCPINPGFVVAGMASAASAASAAPSEEEVYNYYNAFLSNALQILNIIAQMGNCNCTDDSTVLSCNTSFQQICWKTLEHFEFTETIPSQGAVQQDTSAMIAGINTTAQPIWRPNTKYYIKFRLKDEVDNGLRPSGNFDYYYGFKTVGPVGHFHNYPGAYPIPATIIVDGETVAQIPEEFPLTSLRKYIDYERSYPNADGNLILAKPLFYESHQCKIDIYFAKPFAYHMVTKWEEYNGLKELNGTMHLAIKDPISQSIIPYPLTATTVLDEYVPETVLNGANGWVSDDDPRIPHNIQILNNYIDNVNANPGSIECSISLGNAIKPASYTYSVTLESLNPRKLYTALVYNAFDVNSDTELVSQKVHEFVFQTSRYKDFRDQVDSFMLKEKDDSGAVINQKDAVYQVALPLTTAQVNNAYALVTSSNTPQTLAIETQFYHPFDRVIEGVFGLKPIDPPTTTDFITIVNNETGYTVAVIIRNPEPFNNPKIPLQQVLDTIKFYPKKSLVEDTHYKVLFSKDYSQMIVMHDTKKIASAFLYIVFKYKIWDGSNYIVPDEDGIVTGIPVPTDEKLYTIKTTVKIK
jgi:hypothetical protein